MGPPLPSEPDQGAAAIAPKTTTASLIRGGLWTTMANVIPQVYTLALSIATARFLGPVDTGKQSYISFIVSFVIVMVSFGLPITAQRFLSNALGGGRIAEVHSLYRLLWPLGIGLGLVGGAAVTAFQLIAYPELYEGWFLAGIATIFVIFHAFISQTLFALQKFSLVSLFGLISGLLTVVLTLPVLALGYGITGFFAAGLVPAVLSAAGTAWLAHRAMRDIPRPEPQARRWVIPAGLLGFGAAAFFADIIEFMLNRRSEFFFLQAWSPASEIAMYSIGFAAVAAAAQIPVAFVTVVLPAVSSLFGAGQMDRVRNGYRRALRIVFHVTAPLAAAAAVLGPPAIRIFFGEQYRDAGILVVIMVPVSLVLVPIGSIATATLIGTGRMKIVTGAGLAALAGNVTMAFLLIRPWGAVGAALANTTGQLISALLALTITTRILKQGWLTPRLWRTIVASLAAAAAGLAGMALEPSAGVVVAFIVACAASLGVYLLLAVTLRVMGADEASTLIGAVGARVSFLAGVLARVSERPKPRRAHVDEG